ncbi:hypothetical protein BpHYR1_008663 [Brachionus plicatilis]|uniref:Uncharacterized protein n=1 Tax=Brachionus plicatilis TaxID=10195 RepID=A0A3M7TAC7_BRAPC|nr:hypothetical protein BpHYR1_008663 [Brachionus plicatilis]
MNVSIRSLISMFFGDVEVSVEQHFVAYLNGVVEHVAIKVGLELFEPVYLVIEQSFCVGYLDIVDEGTVEQATQKLKVLLGMVGVVFAKCVQRGEQHLDEKLHWPVQLCRAL